MSSSSSASQRLTIGIIACAFGGGQNLYAKRTKTGMTRAEIAATGFRAGRAR